MSKKTNVISHDGLEARDYAKQKPVKSLKLEIIEIHSYTIEKNEE